MSDKVTLYYHPMSRARTTLWMLEEVGAPYELMVLNLEKGEHKSPAFLGVNPMGKLPAIVHHNTVITESAAICAYLADAFPQAKLAPATDDPRRGTYYRWLFFAIGCLEPAMMDKAFNRPPVRQSTIGYGTYEATLSAVEKALAPGPFILGKQFSAADVFLAGNLGYGMMVNAIEKRPAFVNYMKIIADRPAYQRSEAQANKLMAELTKN